MGNSSFDCLLVHPVDYRGRISYHPVMPMGFFSLADYLTRRGLKCRIINLAVELRLDRNFSIEKYLSYHPTKIVGLDLHWYVHSHAAIAWAQRIKAYDPKIKVVLGGYTASFFDREILDAFPCIDAVVRGEGEIPLAQLASDDWGKDPAEIPGITYRDNGIVLRNEQICYPEAALLDELNFANLDLVEHWEAYVSDCARPSFISYVNIPQTIAHLFYLSIGRGCGHNCSYCGGSQTSYRHLCGRPTPYLRPAAAVVNELRELAGKGINNIYFEYDPLPDTEIYYLDLFERIRQAGLKIGANFSCWGLPDKEFLARFSRTFQLHRSCLCFVPKSGSETVRRLNKSNSYSNEQFVACIETACGHGIYPSINYKVGLPGETPATINETLKLHQRLSSLPLIQSISLPPTDPGAPMFVHPDKYGIVMHRRTFRDFYETYRNFAQGRLPRHPIGFHTDSFSEKKLIKLKMSLYRRFYFSLHYLTNRQNNTSSPHMLFKYILIFLSIVFGAPRVSLLEER